MTAALEDAIFSSDHRFYQEVTKKLNDYYYDLRDVVCVKCVKDHTTLYTIEIHVLNENFNTPIKLKGIVPDQLQTMLINISRDINVLSRILKAYLVDVSKLNINSESMQYLTNFVNTCISSVEKYEICIISTCDETKPGYDINFTIIGNLSNKPIKKDISLAMLSLRYALRQVFPSMDKSLLKAMIKRYENIFVETCIQTDSKRNVIYH